MIRIASLVALSLFLLGPLPVRAHPMAPSVLSFEPMAGDGWIMRWRAPSARPIGQSLRPRVPDGCTAVNAPERTLDEEGSAYVEVLRLRCDAPDLVGTRISVDGFEDSSVNVVVRILSREGQAHHVILDARVPEITVSAARERSHSFVEYLSLGVEHLLTGWDHLTFVLGLMILFGWQRRLIAAVTAFTLGHSLTLALSVLGILSVPQTLVEALIAMTIVVLALEIQSGNHGPVWRHPWTLPGSLGLLHGLGFASVLFDAGLPSDEIPLAQLGFNLGLEVGQLGVIAVAGVLYMLLRPVVPRRWHETATVPAYVIGSLAAFWVIERTLAALGFSI